MRIVTHNPGATGKNRPVMSITDDKDAALSFYHGEGSPRHCYASYIGNSFDGPNIVVKQPMSTWTAPSKDVSVQTLSTGRVFIAIGSDDPGEITVRFVSPDTSGYTGKMAFEAMFWENTIPSYNVSPSADQVLCLININGTIRKALRMHAELSDGGSSILVRFYISDNIDTAITWDIGTAAPVNLTSSTYTDGVGAYTAQEVATYVETSAALAQMVDNSVENHVSDISRKYTSC